MKILDLCSGVGVGFPFASLKLGGFEIEGFCERDEFCQNILSKRFPGIPIHREVNPVSRAWVGWAKPDIITASPPCQPFSIQGKRLAANDDRDCFPAVLQAIASFQPSYFCIENVPGLLNCPYFPGSNCCYFQYILHCLCQCGFDVEWLCVSSGHFGAPWLRRRLLLVGKSNSIQLDGARSWAEQVRGSIEGFRNSPQGAFRKPGVVREALLSAIMLDQPAGKPNRSSVDRARRKAIGNALDWRVASVALERIKYYEELRNG